MQTITVKAGYSKSGEKEMFSDLVLQLGEIYAVTGHTGSGKAV